MSWREKVDNFVKENVYDPDRISSEECSKLGLPFIDDGKFYNTHAFSETANHFYEHKCYTVHPSNSKAEVDFWKEERRRKREGLWLGQLRISGYHYFFLNYHHMKVIKDGEEIDGFGSFWRIHFWVFHLLDFADYTKQNIALIKLRGCGLSELAASIGEADFLIPNKDSRDNTLFWNNSYFAADDRYIGGDDQLWSKMTKAVEFVNKNCNGAIFNRPGYSMNNTDYHWVAGYRDKENTAVQTGGEFKATILKKADQARGGRKKRIFWEECNILGTKVLCYDGVFKKIEDIQVGDYVMGIDSKPREVLKTTRGKGKILSLYTHTKKKSQSKPFMYVTPNHRLWVTNKNQTISTAIKAEKYLELDNHKKDKLYAVKFTNNSLTKKEVFKFTVKDEGIEDEYVGLTLDGDQLYMTDDFVITHNSGANQFLGKGLTVAEGTTRRATVKTGTQIIWGTSNEDSRGIDAFKKVLQSPNAYDCMVFENVWEKVRDGREYLDRVPWNPFDYILKPGSDGVGFFIPAYDVKHLDENGNPDIYKGYDEIIEERANKLKNVDSQDEDVLQYFADYPLYMEEALMTSKGKRFSSDELSRQMVNVETKLIEPDIKTGYLDYVRNGQQVIGVKWTPSPRGKIRLLEHPKWITNDGDTKVSLIKNHSTSRLYIAGIDSIDQDLSDSSASDNSDLACLIKKRRDTENGLSDVYSNAYVALYRERPERIKNAYDNVLKMLIYYNAQALLEYTKFNIKSHIVDIMKFPDYLAYEPAAPGSEIKNYRKKIKRQGMRATKDVIHYYLGKIEDYINDYSEKILFPELLRELVDYEYDLKRKFDLVAAMGMCEILYTELLDRNPIDLLNRVKDTSLGESRWIQDPRTKKWFFGKEKDIFNFKVKNENRDLLYYDKNNKPVYR